MPARTLVVVFLRGGADGLHLLPPLGEGAGYREARPGLAVPERGAVPLDHRFALHPELAPLEPLYRRGSLAVVPACGSDDDTRSHFEAQDLMEHGAREVGGGWVGRWLAERRRAGEPAPALSAVSLEKSLPESLRGAPRATPLASLEQGLGLDPALSGALGALYALDRELAAPARNAQEAALALARLGDAPRSTALYPEGVFGSALARIAGLIAADVGLEAACVDLPGWDSHFVQSSLLEPLMRQLARGLAAFAEDLGPRLDTTSLVVMTEFGRRLYENAAGGTDHGRASVMLLMGGGVRGGVRGGWPGLGTADLEGPGDVAVADDYRDVLAGVLGRHGRFDARRVFPGRETRPLEI